MKNYQYESITYENIPKRGYVIVDSYLLLIKNGHLEESLEISGSSINELIKSAREIAELPPRTTIYVDDSEIFDIDTIFDSGRLITDDQYFDEMDEEESEGWEELAEHFADF